ncbi:formylglycine-generating enzyme family protein [Amycolatopsis antarctica]|uniref:formylglycine-generating enzyme family protein n=1 Tax=Amycolatopsis antarctica TaxID=1854586 RepID=UPI00196AB231|nr:SUMF1/EgtB/PvdO family nonheme iron enzyme [Amycolatopsis antarctica]
MTPSSAANATLSTASRAQHRGRRPRWHRAADAFQHNGYSLYNVCGNVWEWYADRFDDPHTNRAMRGGFYLCHDLYCNRCRVAARTGNSPDSSVGNLGFRTAADV